MILILLLVIWLLICAGAIYGIAFMFGDYIRQSESLLIPSIASICIIIVLIGVLVEIIRR